MRDITSSEVEVLDEPDEVADSYEDDGDDELEIAKFADFPISNN